LARLTSKRLRALGGTQFTFEKFKWTGGGRRGNSIGNRVEPCKSGQSPEQTRQGNR
jgi:hypothetical protein